MVEGNESPSVESTSIESTATEATEVDSGYEAPTNVTPPASTVVEQKPEPESLRSRMEKKMAKAKERDDAATAAIAKGEISPDPAAEAAKKAAAKTVPVVPGVTPAPAGEAPAPKPGEYAPNFKYKFAGTDGKQIEKDLPDWAKAGIKDAESEKEIRSIFEKANGLDFAKPRYEQAKVALQEMAPRLQNYDTQVAKLKEHYSKGNMKAVFEQLGITEEKVLQYAIERAKYYELPPEQQSVIQQQEMAERNAELAQQQAYEVQGRYEEQARQIKQLQLSQVLSRPDVVSASQNFDQRVGKDGAFFEQVKLHGETTYYRSGGKIDLTPEEAITQVMAAYGLQNPGQAPAGTPPVVQAAPNGVPPAATSAPAPAPAQTVKVIPNVNARPASPAMGKPKVRSIEDLKKIAKEMNG